MDNTDYVNRMTELIKQSRDLSLEHWLKNELLSWQWWLGVALIVLPLIFWWLKVDKKRLLEIGFFGLFVVLLAIFMDVSGAEMLVWFYPIRIMPQTPLLFPVDIVDLPIVLMLIYQRYGKWGKFILVNVIISAAMAFIAEPAAVFIGVYQLVTWKFIYSFPIYVLVAVLAKIITGFFWKKQSAK